jgi:hypothetical protein
MNDQELIALVKQNYGASKSIINELFERKRRLLGFVISKMFSGYERTEKKEFIYDIVNDFRLDLIEKKLIENYEPALKKFDNYLCERAWYYVMNHVLNSSKGKFETFKIDNFSDFFTGEDNDPREAQREISDEAENISIARTKRISFFTNNNFQTKYFKRRQLFIDIYREFIDNDRIYQRNLIRNLPKLKWQGTSLVSHILRKEIMKNAILEVLKKGSS